MTAPTGGFAPMSDGQALVRVADVGLVMPCNSVCHTHDARRRRRLRAATRPISCTQCCGTSGEGLTRFGGSLTGLTVAITDSVNRFP
jgi:hypothetical protein